ncbi:MAG: ATP phosphoribosyltransferase [Candidatus Ranarchaeia archaeon]
MAVLRFAIPKGSLEEKTFVLLKQAGYSIRGQKRSYAPMLDDPEVSLRLLRPQEIPTLIAEGSHDLGISGIDWVEETCADVVELGDLEYGRVRLVLAVPEDWNDVKSLGDLLERFSTGKPLRIATEYLNLASSFLKKNPVYQRLFGDSTPTVITPWYRFGDNPNVKLILSFGATEAKPPKDADAIFDNTETGTTLRQNHLKIIEEPMVSTARLISNKAALQDPFKREKILDILTLLRGVVDARRKLHIFANVEEKNLEKIMEVLPALKSPTISKLSTPGWLSINTVIDRTKFLQLIPKLRQLAQGIVVYEPRQVLPLGDIGEFLQDEKD